jgi:Tol biopolymer transport system component
MGIRRKGSRGSQRGLLVVVAAVVVGVLVGCDTTPVVVSGTVTAAPSGAGVGGVLVQVYADDAETLVAETTSDVGGAWVVRASTLADGVHRVRIGERWWPDAGSWAEADGVALSAGSPTVLDVSFDEVGDLVGGVVDDDGVPVPGVMVVAVRASDGLPVGRSSTDLDGAFTIPVVAADSHRLLVADPAGIWPSVYVGGATPTDFAVTTGTVWVGIVDVSTGVPASALGVTTRVSVASDGTQSNNHSEASAISADGRHVTFASKATSLVPGGNGLSHVFAHDRSTGVTTRVSVASDGTVANGSSFDPAISADGRHVTFSSNATNLVAGYAYSTYDVFVHDRWTGETTQASVASDGTPANHSSYHPVISADGRYVAFESLAANLVAGDTNDSYDVFVHDRSTGVTTRVSVASDGTQATYGTAGGGSYSPVISGDGRNVAFVSNASTLVGGDTNGRNDVFLHDRSTGVTSRVSVASDGTQADNASVGAAISADGRYVTFSSTASNLVSGDTNGFGDVFVHDRSTGTTTRVSVASDGTQASNSSVAAAISADGRYVSFASYASNLVAGDTGATDGFVHDRATGVTSRVSVASDGTQANGDSSGPVISADGRSVAFTSNATNLVAGDTNYGYDVFVHVRLAA